MINPLHTTPKRLGTQKFSGTIVYKTPATISNKALIDFSLKFCTLVTNPQNQTSLAIEETLPNHIIARGVSVPKSTEKPFLELAEEFGITPIRTPRQFLSTEEHELREFIRKCTTDRYQSTSSLQ